MGDYRSAGLYVSYITASGHFSGHCERVTCGYALRDVVLSGMVCGNYSSEVYLVESEI
jgi:hypothetical protein